MDGGAAGPHDTARAERARGHAALVATQLCFGLFPVFGALALTRDEGFTAFGLAIWRCVTGAAVLATVAFARHGARAIPARRDVLPLLGYAVLGVVLNQGLFVVGLARTTPMNAGLLICLIPVFTYTVAAGLGREPFRGRRALGVALALAGSAPLFVARGADLAAEHALGNALIALNCFCYSLYLVLSKRMLERYPPIVVIAWLFLLSLPFVPVFAVGEPLGPAVDRGAIWASFAFVLVFPTVLAYFLNTYALARVPASTTAFYVYSQPLITAVGAAAVFGERPTPTLGVAALGLFVGVALVSRRAPRASSPVPLRPTP